MKHKAISLAAVLVAAQAFADSNGPYLVTSGEHEHDELEAKVERLRASVDNVSESLRDEIRSGAGQLDTSIAARTQEVVRTTVEDALQNSVATELSEIRRGRNLTTYFAGTVGTKRLRWSN